MGNYIFSDRESDKESPYIDGGTWMCLATYIGEWCKCYWEVCTKRIQKGLVKYPSLGKIYLYLITYFLYSGLCNTKLQLIKLTQFRT